MALPDKIVEELILLSKEVPLNELSAISAKAKRNNASLIDLILEENKLSRKKLNALIRDKFDVEVVKFPDTKVDKDAVTLISKDLALEREVLPFKKTKGGLHIAMTNPIDLETIEFLEKRTGLKVVPYYTNPSSFRKGILSYKKDIKEVLKEMIKKRADESSKKGKSGKVEKAAKELPVIELFDSIAEYAVVEKASDFHIEPLENEIVVRYRIDGILRDVVSLPKRILSVLVARVKIMSNLKIDEHRLPQDGRIKITINKQDISLRISILPTYFGEKVVARVLEESAEGFTLQKLGFTGVNLERVSQAITRPNGMILSTGPTGSGKTTTLYTILSQLNTPEVNINTIEDPIEYAVSRVNQTQVHPKIGLTFAMGLRALLRQDPDIIMVGEIRDEETASIAVNAALTGHLVLSTVHTNSASGAIPRLIDMGIEEFLLASSIKLVIAQRLVRRICKNCKKAVELTQEQAESITRELKKAGLSDVEISQLVGDRIYYEGKGCNVCKGSGYKGRTGIYEVLEVDDKIVDLISSKAPADEIQDEAQERGMELMVVDGFKKAKDGNTTISEVLRVIRE